MRNYEQYTGPRRVVAALTLSVLSLTALAGCSWQDLNPSGSATHGADLEAHSTREILAAYPDATDIEVTHADDNPNYMHWYTDDGDTYCTAFASMTQNKGRTPGDLVSEPYCRPAAPTEK